MVSTTRIAVAVAAVVAMGCGKQTPRYPVAGRVLVDGEPLVMGTIRLVPESGRPVSGTIMPDGSFMLSERSLTSSRMTDGVMPGIYRVSVSAAKVVDEDADEVEWLAPSKYADFRTSGIKLNIDRPHDDLVVDLNSHAVEISSIEIPSTDGQMPATPKLNPEAD